MEKLSRFQKKFKKSRKKGKETFKFRKKGESIFKKRGVYTTKLAEPTKGGKEPETEDKKIIRYEPNQDNGLGETQRTPKNETPRTTKRDNSMPKDKTDVKGPKGFAGMIAKAAGATMGGKMQDGGTTRKEGKRKNWMQKAGERTKARLKRFSQKSSEKPYTKSQWYNEGYGSFAKVRSAPDSKSVSIMERTKKNIKEGKQKGEWTQSHEDRLQYAKELNEKDRYTKTGKTSYDVHREYRNKLASKNKTAYEQKKRAFKKEDAEDRAYRKSGTEEVKKKTTRPMMGKMEEGGKVYENESGRKQVAKKKGLSKLGSNIKTAITGKVGKEYKHQGTIRQDVNSRRAKRLIKKQTGQTDTHKGSSVHTWDGGKTNTNIKKRNAWDAKTKDMEEGGTTPKVRKEGGKFEDKEGGTYKGKDIEGKTKKIDKSSGVMKDTYSGKSKDDKDSSFQRDLKMFDSAYGEENTAELFGKDGKIGGDSKKKETPVTLESKKVDKIPVKKPDMSPKPINMPDNQDMNKDVEDFADEYGNVKVRASERERHDADESPRSREMRENREKSSAKKRQDSEMDMMEDMSPRERRKYKRQTARQERKMERQQIRQNRKEQRKYRRYKRREAREDRRAARGMRETEGRRISPKRWMINAGLLSQFNRKGRARVRKGAADFRTSESDPQSYSANESGKAISRRERRNLGGKFRRKRGGDDSANYGGVQRGSRRTRNEKRRLYKGGGMNKGVGDYKDGGKTSKKGMGVVIIVGKPKVKRKGKN